MPHCIIEYSKNLENSMPINELVRVVHSSVFASGLFEESSIKARAIEFIHFQTGLSDTPFIHITLKILQGRDHQQKKDLTKLVLDTLSEVIPAPLSLSVEVMDIEKVSYKKIVIK
ncbi:5-carboxymethyl-2-hydroxymuconate Delta-isomerase [Paraglaciecola sp. MB-3u-78]|uniref:5-carboxymethyl-2-hydroxymuconate Delta-isomerase n=1 Tax=Paraglaciecola sp. MB-3u-78 TaxID=2058332 RepID=UPI000C32D017|nr:5-carboxymethyl-2-hydroxymuconate Delta-isomerase [Paraglaciecola sp. MB-3u-78]PKG99039.1 5-carboxymethyl-2-hydroxymuconate isomerase [Paraglaciecola sp. MB-3u-78]